MVDRSVLATLDDDDQRNLLELLRKALAR